MSRSNYTDDPDGLWLYRKAVDRAIRGRRGRAVLAEIKSALETMPVKQLARDTVAGSEGVCAMGAAALARGVPRETLEEQYEAEETAATLGISYSLAAEIAFENDDHDGWHERTPEERFDYMLGWVEEQLAKPPLGSTERGHCGCCAREFTVSGNRVHWHKFKGAKCPGSGEPPAQWPPPTEEISRCM